MPAIASPEGLATIKPIIISRESLYLHIPRPMFIKNLNFNYSRKKASVKVWGEIVFTLAILILLVDLWKRQIKPELTQQSLVQSRNRSRLG